VTARRYIAQGSEHSTRENRTGLYDSVGREACAASGPRCVGK